MRARLAGIKFERERDSRIKSPLRTPMVGRTARGFCEES